MTTLKEIAIDEIISTNQTLCLLLGYGMAINTFLMSYLKNNNITMCDSDQEKNDWWFQAIENVLYLQCPLPKMP